MGRGLDEKDHGAQTECTKKRRRTGQQVREREEADNDQIEVWIIVYEIRRIFDKPEYHDELPRAHRRDDKKHRDRRSRLALERSAERKQQAAHHQSEDQESIGQKQRPEMIRVVLR